MPELPHKYQKPSPQRADLSKLPAHIREAITTPVPLHQQELYLLARVWKNATTLHPNARLVVAWSDDPEHAPKEVATILLRDFHGRERLLQLELGRASLKQFADSIYKLLE